MWAIQRLVVRSIFTCQGMLQKVWKCKKRVSKGKNPNPAPCFLGMRQWEGKSKETSVWCCSDNATHVWNVCPYIVMRPPRPPLEWPVCAKGTNLTRKELACLTQVGFHIATVEQEELCESWPRRFDQAFLKWRRPGLKVHLASTSKSLKWRSFKRVNIRSS